MRKLISLMMAVVFGVACVYAQSQSISGTVVDAADNSPLPGASIMPVGGGQGTSTDIDGKFTLTIPAKVKTVTVSYVGYATKTVPVSKNMTIALSQEDNALDEVMVVAYGTAKKSAYTGSASVVKSEALETALVSNATDALAGKIAGVQILSSNGQPGTSPSVRIRGIGSINGSNSPLYVVDGIPYDGDISGINTMDIESMTVLKDAAAAALYGARGANGVILVTTKNGKKGDAKVTVDARWGANHRAIPNYDVIKGTDTFVETVYQALYNAAYYNLSNTPAGAHAYANAQIVPSLGYQVYTLPNGETLVGTNGKINPNATLGYSDGNYYYTPDDWAKEQYRDGLRQEYNLSISGGSDKINYFLSGAYLGDEGLIKGSYFNRFASRATVDYQVKKWLKVGTNLAYTYTRSGYPGDQTTDYSNSSGNAFLLGDQIAPYYPMYVRDKDGKIVKDPTSGLPVYDYGNGESTPNRRNWMALANPAGTLAYDTEEYLSDTFNGKWFAQLTPVDGLTITGTAGLFIDNTRYHNVGNPWYGQSVQEGGSAIQANTRTRALNFQALANYTRTFADKHDLDILLGYESYGLNIEVLEGVGYNLYNPNSWAMDNTIDNKTPYGYYMDYATRGLFGRVNYSFDSRYFGSVSVRRDASSRFAPGHRWGTFWSVSGAWDISKEKFMQEAVNVDQLKLKASFGQQGNDNVNTRTYITYYPWMDLYTIGGANGVWSDGQLYYKGNRDLTWETSNNFNVGVDYSFFKGMLYGSVEYFNRQTSDMLYNKPVSPSNGYTNIPMNVGSMRNNGVEIEINYRPISNQNLTWDINFNITTMGNKVLSLHSDLNGQMISGSRIYREGESMYQLYLVKYAGVDPATGLALYWDGNPKMDENGNAMKDKAGNYIIEEEFLSTDYNHAYSYNRKSSGNLLPKAYGGFGTTLNFFGVDFSMAFAYQFGGRIWDYTYQDMMHGGDSSSLGHNWHTDIFKAWTPENTITDVPRLDNLDTNVNASSDRWLTSSNYLSLNNITLGYTFPAKWVNKLGLSNVRIYGSAENLFVWTARKGMDPRQDFATSEGATYSGSRCISGGIHIEF